jgi:aspartate/tyrosine/aromatic aminotransferase
MSKYISNIAKNMRFASTLVSQQQSYFDNIFNKVNEDIIFKTQNAFNNDTSKDKVNLGIGIFADENGVLPPVKSRYLPLSGDTDFLNASEKFVFGQPIKNMFKFQTCGGTGALSLAEQIINYNRVNNTVYAIPLPTWPNHLQIFKGKNILEYSENVNFSLNYPKTNHPDVLLVQTSCHNPTGIDYTHEEKTHILDYADKNNVTIIFDTAYLGLSGKFKDETSFLKMAEKRNIDFIVCLSYSKIGDVYGHRTGALFFRPKRSENINYENIKANVEQLIRSNISNSPRFGSDLMMEQYLGDDNKMKQFYEKIQNMANRINIVREKFGKDLKDNGIINDISIGKGMFSLLKLSPLEIVRLQQIYHIYLLPNGRINICGITNKNYEYIVNSIIENHKIMENKHK